MMNNLLFQQTRPGRMSPLRSGKGFSYRYRIVL